MCGDTSAVMPARAATSCSIVQALCRDSRPPRAFRKSAGRAGTAPGQRRAGSDQVRVERRPGVRADRHDPLLAALAEHPQAGCRLAGATAGQPGRPRPRRVRRPRRSAARCRRAAPAAPRRAAPARCRWRHVEHRLHLVQAERLRQPARRPGRMDGRGRVVGSHALGDGEPVQAAHRDDGPGHARRAQRRARPSPSPSALRTPSRSRMAYSSIMPW